MSGKSERAASETDSAVVAARSPALEDVLGVTHPTEPAVAGRSPGPAHSQAQQSSNTFYAVPRSKRSDLDTERCD
jgi:hypothetical protein